MPTVERVFEGCLLGEGPHWDISTQSLYLVDIFGKNILKYVPATKKLTKAAIGKHVSFIIPVEGKKGHFVISLDHELVLISWDGESDKISIIKTLTAVNTTEEVPMIFNDAKCDSFGRLWTGTYYLDQKDWTKSNAVGTLYSLNSNLQLKSHFNEILCPNGIAFNDKTKKMFYIDSFTGRVDRFDFDIESATISNRQAWFTLGIVGNSPLPDGMTIDTDGNLWVATFSGSRVIKVDGSKPETLLDTVEIPADQVTSVTFGGPNLDELYVTTAAVEFDGKKRQPPVHGATYKVTDVGVKGLPAVNFKLD